MKKKTINSFSIFRLAVVLGFILCLGSIFTFIVMNMVSGNNPPIEAIYWQRLFVSKITDVLILPGLALIVANTTILSWLHYGVLKYRAITIIQILVILIAINSIHISLLAHKVTDIAVLQYRLSTWIKDYEAIKSAEDMFGGINMILLLICFVLFMTVKPKRSLPKGV